jgi:hypothetical protein
VKSTGGNITVRSNVEAIDIGASRGSKGTIADFRGKAPEIPGDY